ncbi:MAG: hypothetical protein PHO02_06445 [Candidatus Nanoarchaeia archaeon]|nr:hypothetical protein [Candidatus Nanoarchaeia archaeon]
MGIEAKKGLEFMLADQARLARVMAGEEHDVKLQTAFEKLVEDMSLIDIGLFSKTQDFAAAYEQKEY